MYFLQSWSTLVALICILCVHDVTCVVDSLADKTPLTGGLGNRHCPTQKDIKRLREALTSGSTLTLDLPCVDQSNYTILDIASQVKDRVI
ncbi:uncharacterized protein DEA37_0001793 [Paragonimus westermani]|uniref:Uncharacterized protein n=1 Tax=Paragonimus westermani TaxID=34504 RepID=A0A5J4NWM8_9TREM|nr:uncharacterized protein DEA37_0001793 [Paragonimus westermani]